MKTWFSEYTFKHNWETVVQATARKYPNPHNNSVTSIDVLERRLCPTTGALVSHRLVASEFAVARNFGRLYASELTAIDPRERRMVMRTKNLSLCSLLTATERMEYRAHPDNPEWTQLTQSIEIHAFPTIADSIVKISSSNASKGREAIEWVIQTQLEQPLLDFLAAPLPLPDSSSSASAIFDSYVSLMRAEVDQLSSKAARLSRDLGDELSSLGGDLVASVSQATTVHAAAPEMPAIACERDVPAVVADLWRARQTADEHFMIL